MNTPIVDFVKNYIDETDTLRLHMPGHKGYGLSGGAKENFGGSIAPEAYDLPFAFGQCSILPLRIRVRLWDIESVIKMKKRVVYVSAHGSWQGVMHIRPS